MVSHELRGPLTSIKGSAATVLGSTADLDPAVICQFFQIIGSQADHMNQLVSDLLDVVGIESFWSLVKSGYIGVYHYLSPQHLHRYINEFAYRQSVGSGNGFKTIGKTFGQMNQKRLTYKDLTGRGLEKRERTKVRV